MATDGTNQVSREKPPHDRVAIVTGAGQEMGRGIAQMPGSRNRSCF
jgi:hypothetical protein